MRKILGAPFRQAVKLGTLSKNPLANVPPLKKGRFEKGVFTPEEISRLVNVAEARLEREPSWSATLQAPGFKMLPICAGMQRRPGKKIIRFRIAKTDQAITLAIHPELEDHLITCADSDNSRAFVFPNFSRQASPALSIAFKEIMEKAGIEAGVARREARS